MDVPVLETERLILRGHDLRDFEPMLEMWGDAGVTRFIGGKPSSRSDVWGRLLRYIGHWAVLDYGYWAVEEKATGRFVGEVGFADFKREMTPSFEGMREVGWSLAPWAQGRGYATEAVTAALAWGGEHFTGLRVVCMINPDNAPSMRVAEKCGFTVFAETNYEGARNLFLERT